MKTETFMYENPGNHQGKYKKLALEDLVIPSPDEDRVLPQKSKRFQRNATKIVKRMAERWDWVLCGALRVVAIDGVNYVIDGGTRLRGARLHGKIKHLPCMVYEFPEAQWQSAARAYLGTNTIRKNQRKIELHHSAIDAGDPQAIAAEQIVQDGGYTTYGHKDDYTFDAIAALYRIMDLDKEIAATAFRVCSEIAKGGRIHKELLFGVFELERQSLRQRRKPVWTDATIAKMAAAGVETIRGAINNRRAVMNHSGGGSTRTVNALGILDLLNKGCRSGKIRLAFD